MSPFEQSSRFKFANGNSSSANPFTNSGANGLHLSNSNLGRRGEKTPLLNSTVISDSLVSKSFVGDLQLGVSWGVAAFLLVNTALGAGMLNYPYAYNQIGGVFAAAFMQVVSLSRLNQSHDRTQTSSC